MDNILYRFIADRDTPILDNIEKYCISENKEELTIVRIVFDFLERIKYRLDDSFVKVCIEHIAKNADEKTKKVLSRFSASEIRALKGHKDMVAISKESLKKIEGGNGDITELMYFLINSDETEWGKVMKLQERAINAKNWIYTTWLAGLYSSEESGIKVEYINYLGDRIAHTYTRSEFIQDIELVNAHYDDLAKEKLSNAAEGEKKENITKYKPISDIMKFAIVRDEKKIGYIFNYLEKAGDVIREARDKKETTGALCLAFYQFDIFKNKPAFTTLLGILSEYWGVTKPANDKPGKYENKLVDLRNRHLFLNKGLI